MITRRIFPDCEFSMTVQDTLQAVRAHEDEFIALRRDIHQHPELPFEELRTSDLVAARLRDWGYHVERGLAEPVWSGNSSVATARARWVCADMDALPIQETTGLQYASRNQGVMHACGHDGHTAMLLAAAKVLAEQGDFSGDTQPDLPARGGIRHQRLWRRTHDQRRPVRQIPM